MRADEKTLRDLDLFRSRDGGRCLFEHLNQTKTTGGRRALRTRFENPLSDPVAIRQVQDGVRFLMEHEIRFSPDPRLIAQVIRYLESPYDVASRRTGSAFLVEAWWVQLRYRDLVREAREGVAAAQRLFGQVRALLDRIEDLDPPQEVRRPTKGLVALMERLELDGIRAFRRPWAMLEADRHLRRRHKADLARLFELLADLDALCGMAEVAGKDGYSLPEILDGDSFFLEGEGVFHPFLQDPVGNPVRMTGEERVVFLTGPNMAGKTTYLKTVALCAYLAHLGMAVPALAFRVSPLDALFTSFSPEDGLRKGLSFFMAEVERVREVATALVEGKRTLAFFDEVFKGTNVKDALDASRIVVKGFSRARRSGFVFASHLTELVEDLRAEGTVRFEHFDSELRGGRAFYEFRLKPGVSQRRLGLHLLEQEGIPELLETIGVRALECPQSWTNLSGRRDAIGPRDERTL